jgi:transient receptor potential cation channel subfamily V member 5
LLAKRLVHHFPKMVNDIFTSDEFYGESPLHIAIINENPHMAKMLLKHGADVHQRACGKFFCPEDQKSERIDNLLSEYASLPSETDYSGYFYYGEYPLSWAAVLNQVECVRLLVAYGANVNKQDSNGNTALHMLVISNNLVKIIYFF